jgi:small subunit ribosomal protein S20
LANIKASKKDIRKSEKRRIANSQKKSSIRTQAKNILKSLKSGKLDEAKTLFVTYASLLDKAAQTNLIHRKNASRHKSRMAVKINSGKVA